MKGKQLHIRSIAFVCALFLLLSAVIVGGQGLLSAFAAERTQHSSVLEDLQLDKSFTAEDYPADDTDHNVYIIQIAETTEGELFIYTHQPAQLTKYHVALDVNMCLTKDMTTSKLYPLELLNCEGVLCKYVVKDFTVSDEETRYYNITSIHREWVKGIDTEPPKGNTTSGARIAVGQLWTATTVDGIVQYDCKDVEYIDITQTVVSKIRHWDNAVKWYGRDSVDAHYFAFNTDREIDNLLSADISFVTQYYRIRAGKIKELGAKTPQTRTVDYTMTGQSLKKDKWQRLSSVEDFIKENNVSAAEKEILDGYEWIINFYESIFEVESGGKDVLIFFLIPLFGIGWNIENGLTTNGEWITDVSLMRLEYLHDGQVYNLGAVSDISSGSNEVIKGKHETPWWMWVVIAIVVPPLVAFLLTLISFFLPVLTPVCSVLWKVIGMFYWWTICLPFRGIAALVKRIKSKREEKT